MTSLNRRFDSARPSKLHYDPMELQRCVTLCMGLGMFSASVQTSCPFTYEVVSHVDTFDSQRPSPE